MTSKGMDSVDNNNNNEGSLKSIDGSKGEGGGQILRNSVSFAAIMNKSVYIDKIRSGRPKPGMKAQHVNSVRLIQQICNGQLIDDNPDSTQVTYHPPPAGKEEKGDDDNNNVRTIIGDTGTAGSICLLLQAAIPCALLGTTTKCKLILKGGTNAAMAPQYDYWEKVFLPTLQQQFGLEPDVHIKPNVLKRGFFPKGGGEVHVLTNPLSSSSPSLLPLPSIDLTDRGVLSEIYIRSFHAGKTPKHMAIDMGKAAKSYLLKNLINPQGGTKNNNGHSQQQNNQQVPQEQNKQNGGGGGRKRRRGRKGQKNNPDVNNNKGNDNGNSNNISNNNDSNTANNNNNNNNNNNSNAKNNNNNNNKIDNVQISLDIVTEANAIGNGLGIIVIGKTSTGCLLAGSALGSSRPPFKKAKQVGNEAAEEFFTAYNEGGCVDEWLQDQLILFMALASGTSTLLTGSLTLHTQTAMWIAEEFTGAKFTVQPINDTIDSDQSDNSKNQGASSSQNDNKRDDKSNAPRSFTPLELLSRSSDDKQDDNEYGDKGRIPGKHIITCQGIGYVPSVK